MAMEPVLAALGNSYRLFVQRGGRFGKKIPELIRGTTFDDQKTAKKRAEQGVDMVTGNKEREDGAAAADQGPQSRRCLAPLSLRAKESNPEAAHGSRDADVLPLGLLRRVFFGVLPSTAASSRSSEDVGADLRRVYFVVLPSAAASSICWEDVAAELLARFACRLKLMGPSREKLTLEVIVPSYQRARDRLILLGCDDIVITNGLFTLLRPSEEWISVLTQLCADGNNTIFLVSGQRRNELAREFASCERLGISAEHGNFIRWSKDSSWEYKSVNETIVERLIEGSRARSRIPDFILCIADDGSEDMLNTVCAPSSNSVLPTTAEIFSCTIGDKPSLAKYYLKDPDEVLKVLEGLVDSSAQQYPGGGLPPLV